MRTCIVLLGLAAVNALSLQRVGLLKSFKSRDVASFAAPVQPTTQADLVNKHGLEMALWKTLRGKGGPAEKGMSSTQQAKQLFKKYGAAYLMTSISLALLSYAVSYRLVASGLDVVGLLRRIGLSAVVSPTAGTGTIAYAVHKAASPIRFPPTVALTPLVSRALSGKDHRE